MTAAGSDPPPAGDGGTEHRVALVTIAREWGRIGAVGFGGPPTHISLLRKLCVTERRWLGETEFEDGIATTNLLPGPASTQLAILCAWRLRGAAGALVGGACFILPGLVVILALSALFLTGHPPRWVLGAAAGASAAVPAVAANAAAGLLPASWRRAGRATAARARWTAYLAAGAVMATMAGPWLVLVLLLCGLVETAVRTRPRTGSPGTGSAGRLPAAMLPILVTPALGTGLLAVAWVATKVGFLSYGGGFVIIPLMQSDAVRTYHWMTDAQFLNAVALGQITPGPVVQTVAVVGYAAAGLGGGLLASLVAFAPSFAFVLVGGRHFARLRENRAVQAFLTGAGAAAIGAIAGVTIPLTRALGSSWQYGVLALAALWLLALRRGVVGTWLGAGVLGIVAALAGAPISG